MQYCTVLWTVDCDHAVYRVGQGLFMVEMFARERDVDFSRKVNWFGKAGAFRMYVGIECGLRRVAGAGLILYATCVCVI